MRFVYSCQTDKGNVRSINQDSLLIKQVGNRQRTAVLAAVCDGVGGLSQGEQTSRKTAELLALWADYELGQMLERKLDRELLRHRFQQLIWEINREILLENRKRMRVSGTTLTALLLWDYHYLLAHVGDSRIYRIDRTVTQLTRDHSWIACEMEAGRMTREEAERDRRRNTILQCIGVKEAISPQIAEGIIRENTMFVLCTDGFWRQMREEEWMVYFSPDRAENASCLRKNVNALIQYARQRGESDNITAVALRVC